MNHSISTKAPVHTTPENFGLPTTLIRHQFFENSPKITEIWKRRLILQNEAMALGQFEVNI